MINIIWTGLEFQVHVRLSNFMNSECFNLYDVIEIYEDRQGSFGSMPARASLEKALKKKYQSIPEHYGI